MRKKAIGILIAGILAQMIFAGLEREPNAGEPFVQEMKQECRDIMPYVSFVEGAEDAPLKYRGVAPNWDLLYAGLAKLTDGDFHYYCDALTGDLRKIEYRTERDIRVRGIREKQFLEAADQLCAGVLGEDIFSACEREIIKSREETSYTMEYTYPCGDETNLACSITYLKEGVLLSAFFQDTEALITGENLALTGEITREEALEAAKTEATAFIAKHYPDTFSNYILEEASIEYQKGYHPQKKCTGWDITLIYREEGNEIPFYFNIFVDVHTGEIVENGNNYT